MRLIIAILYKFFGIVPGCKFRYWYVYEREISDGDAGSGGAHLREITEAQSSTVYELNESLLLEEVTRRLRSGNRCLCWFEGGEAKLYVWVYINEGEGGVAVREVARTSLRLELKPGEAYWWDAHVVPGDRQRGIFGSAVEEFLSYCAVRGVRRVLGVIDYGNIASIKSHERAGFRLAQRIVHMRLFWKDAFIELKVCR